jgi:hypothetical protein
LSERDEAYFFLDFLFRFASRQNENEEKIIPFVANRFQRNHIKEKMDNRTPNKKIRL